MPSSYADIFATCLYASGEGLPLWNPSPLRLGDVGYVRDGSFTVLYNAVDGPPSTLSNAANIRLARRSNRSASRGRGRADSNVSSNGGSISMEGSLADPLVAVQRQRRMSGASSGFGSPASEPLSLTTTSEPVTPPPGHAHLVPMETSRSARSSTPPDGPFPPLPLAVDQEPPKLFDMGPRMSSNYSCLGVSAGASVPGLPLGGKITFETSGGDGAILIPRDPTERTVLKHVGVLKEYVKVHRKWMHETYGRIEAIEVDELALIYGQDRTSDWAVAVSKDSNRGAKAEFEVFGVGVNAGFWGNWSHSLSASQRGPHRSSQNSATGASENVTQLQAPQMARAASASGSQPNGGLGLDTGAVNATSPLQTGTSSDAASREEADRPSRRRRSAGSIASISRIRASNAISWAPTIQAPNQTIIIRRVTARTSLGLGFLPARLKAAAEPREPSVERDNDTGTALLVREGAAEDEIQHASQPAQESSCCKSSGSGNRGTAKERWWHDDPLEALHVWIHRKGGAAVHVSIASDDDCVRLLSLLRAGGRVAMPGQLQRAVMASADLHASVHVDEDGVAGVRIIDKRRMPHKPAFFRKRAAVDKENINLFDAAQAAAMVSGRALKVRKPSTRSFRGLALSAVLGDKPVESNSIMLCSG